MQPAAKDEAEIAHLLREFVCADLMRNPSYPIRDDEPLITGGLIDSFCLAHLAVFIELTFGVYIPDTDLTVENLDTLEQMVGRVLQG